MKCLVRDDKWNLFFECFRNFIIGSFSESFAARRKILGMLQAFCLTFLGSINGDPKKNKINAELAENMEFVVVVLKPAVQSELFN